MSNHNSALSKSYTKTSSKSSNTFSSSVKEIMENMPDNLNTKKDIDEYYINAMKDVIERLKEDKTTAKRGRKKGKVDEEGNEIEVVNKPVSNYMKFIEDHRHRIKAVNSGLSPQDLFKVVSELWGIYKEFVIENKEVGDDKLAELWELHLKELLRK